MPQIGPLIHDEKILTNDYVRANISSVLAQLHFRNQLRLLNEYFPEFKRLVTDTWPGLEILELVIDRDYPGDPIGLLVKDGDFCAEVSWMGHGVQMWLQTIWFLARTPRNSCVVIDEPDVYLHPDLQRRLYRLIRHKYLQVIIATHSIEIISEADPRDILVIDKHQNFSVFADNNTAVQRLVDHIGSSQNINLARLYSTKRFLLIEGGDLDFIAHFHSLLFPNSFIPIASIPNLPFGGWGGWDYAIGTKMTIQNYIGDKVITYCILDSDYHTPKQIADRYIEARKRGIELHIWSKKKLKITLSFLLLFIEL